MYFNIESSNDMKYLQGDILDSMKKNNCIIFIRMKGCLHCDMMKNEWNSMVKEIMNDKNLDILEIEQSRMNDLIDRDNEYFSTKLKGVKGFPTIMLQNRDRKVFPFEKERNKLNFLKFIKLHSKPIKILKNKTEPKYGLNSKGKLKQGFRYNHEGELVPAKKKPRVKKSSQKEKLEGHSDSRSD